MSIPLKWKARLVRKKTFSLMLMEVSGPPQPLARLDGLLCYAVKRYGERDSVDFNSTIHSQLVNQLHQLSMCSVYLWYYIDLVWHYIDLVHWLILTLMVWYYIDLPMRKFNTHGCVWSNKLVWARSDTGNHHSTRPTMSNLSYFQVCKHE